MARCWLQVLVAAAVLATTAARVQQLGACRARVRGRLINLEPLQTRRGPPRFHVHHAGWNYTFNPCRSYNLPADPYSGLGDQCHYVAMCQSRDVEEKDEDEFYILGIQRSARFITIRIPHPPKSFPLQQPIAGSETKPSDDVTLSKVELHAVNLSTIVRDQNVTFNATAKQDDLHVVRGPGREEYDDPEYDDLSGDARKTLSSNVTSNVQISLIPQVKSSQENGGGDGLQDEAVLGGHANGEGARDVVANATSEGESHSNQRMRHRKMDRRKEARSKRDVSTDKSRVMTTKLPRRKLDYKMPVLKFRGMRSLRQHKSHVLLICDHTRVDVEEALFRFVGTEGRNHYFELHHQCCCPDGCLDFQTEALSTRYYTSDIHQDGTQSGKTSLGYLPALDDEAEDEDESESESEDSSSENGFSSSDSSMEQELQVSHHRGSEEEDFASMNHTEKMSEIERKLLELEIRGPRFMWIILVVNVALLIGAAIIGTVCCRKGGGHGPYNMLPAIHASSRLTMNSVESYAPGFKSPELLDYSSALHRNTHLPVLDNCIIPARELEIGQRLGGGLFGDTYIAEWKERQVALKRITVGVHQNQLMDEDFEWLGREISYFSRQRHKNVATVLGICLDLRQPHIVNEFIDGECLRDIIRRNESVPMTKLAKLCVQAADGMAFLHSAKYAVLHRDLRSANLLVDKKERVKVVDYGTVKLIQRLRTQCSGHKGCYCQKERSAFPASIRWTAPEVLANPNADEYHSCLTLAVDVYSFALVLWEVATATDPFEDITDENEVMELVLTGHRPPVELIQASVVPQYVDLMKRCWSPDPQERPSFKQVAMQLKDVQQVSYKLEKHRTRNSSETTSYLRSALNLA